MTIQKSGNSVRKAGKRMCTPCEHSGNDCITFVCSGIEDVGYNSFGIFEEKLSKRKGAKISSILDLAFDCEV